MFWIVKEGEEINREPCEPREKGMPQKNTTERAGFRVGNPVFGGLLPVFLGFTSGLICWSDNVGLGFSWEKSFRGVRTSELPQKGTKDRKSPKGEVKREDRNDRQGEREG